MESRGRQLKSYRATTNRLEYWSSRGNTKRTRRQRTHRRFALHARYFPRVARDILHVRLGGVHFFLAWVTIRPFEGWPQAHPPPGNPSSPGFLLRIVKGRRHQRSCITLVNYIILTSQNGSSIASNAELKGVTAKMWLSLSISGHTLVMESPKLGPRVKLFESFSSLDTLTLGPSFGDSITQVWPEIERLSHIFAVTPSSMRKWMTWRMPTFKCHLLNFLRPTAN